MKKLTLVHWVLMFVGVAVLSFVLQCKPKDKQPETVKVYPIIDTTIIEDGDAPIVDNTLTRGKPDRQKKEKISCGFGFKKFNNRKRPIEEAPGGKKGKPVKPPVVQPPTEPPPTGSNNVIYINYFGKTISSTMWNVSGTFTVGDAGLAQEEIDFITAQVRSHFPEYNVNITLDKSVYDAAAFGHKVEIVITEDYQWYGQAGGVAYLNSFFWTDGSPAFVFSLLLNYNTHRIAEAAAHEAGHTLGLRHQSDCENGFVVNQYSNGKTMGVSYYTFPMGAWVIGTSSAACAIQDDRAKLTAAVGLK